MVRTLLYMFGGLLLGLAIHLVVILLLPGLASNTVGVQLAAVGQVNKVVTLDPVAPGGPNPLRLDPELAYAVCRLDLSKGPGELTGTLPLSYWSVSVYDRAGTVLYSTTNRDGIGQTLDLGVFDAAQTRLLAEQKIDVDAGLLIVETRTDDIFVVVKLEPSQPATRDRYAAQLGRLACRPLKT
ncbi:MAG: hypothetical protein BGO82_03935 [Devosia sp. 67-54]|uniref:DUF1254 domain-containing protein n=1 Tax=unclassified Devosia TaxID=196773 RepID=UPI00095EDC9A|nr:MULTISPECIES: hypothetical protein [unclassified Devosia]MBN9305626.1 hypothetical protein [Devosia sp.]OJX19194.1 MAG: hypothetical protein BGO82_03935 [Devosia sp. 67-54]